ncbi:MAG: NADH-quinone oxidoreductase subunit L [Dehalococcoidia bacterium]|nr:NADH-quinone oxidoreductase subunit L [Dehalococcoidia bacterium]
MDPGQQSSRGDRGPEEGLVYLPTITEGAAWAIFASPLVAFALNAAAVRHYPRQAAYLTILAVAVSFALSLWALDSSIEADGVDLGFGGHELLSVGPLAVNAGITLDGLTAIMLVVVTGVSLLVQIYSTAYMAGDDGYARYFAFMALFTASMIGLVIADSLVVIFAFWELVGLCSFLLIGFWFQRPAAVTAARKAFLVTRLGDLGFLAAILLIWNETGTLDVAEITDVALAGAIGSTVLTWFTLGIFAGAAGKSAQFPLHVWLPDAMEGPTPVSALIHAATMVVAGVYLVARLFPIFQTDGDVMQVVAGVGAFTALFAASMALVMTDLKRVLAYSTISQLGYMMLALGSGAFVAAIFHLFTHAFFKALLFLGSGSVNHATGTFDMREMGGLRRIMPITYWTFLLGGLSLSGFFAGFFSKDEILSAAWDENRAWFYVALATVGMTAFYTFRAIWLTFGGHYRGSAGSHDAGAHHAHLAESPLAMALPLAILAVPAVLAGFVNFPEHALGDLLHGALPAGVEEHHFEFRWGIAAPSLVVAAAGIGLAWALYRKGNASIAVPSILAPAQRLLENRYYVDRLYEDVIVGRLFYGLGGGALQLFDRYIVDAAFDWVAAAARRVGSVGRAVQSGQLQLYGAVAFAGLAVMMIAYTLAVNP